MRRKASVSWRDTDKRMRRAVQLRQQGLSLRQIAIQLAVTEPTIRRDLARWEGQEVDEWLRHFDASYERGGTAMTQANDAARKINPDDRRMQ